jgi:hypothetical protein
VTDKVLQNQEMAARTKVTLLMKAFALERRVVSHNVYDMVPVNVQGPFDGPKGDAHKV